MLLVIISRASSLAFLLLLVLSADLRASALAVPPTPTETRGLPPLDVVLANARRRKAPIFGFALGSQLSKPVSVLGSRLTQGDALLVGAALATGEGGFALGLIAGRLSARPVLGGLSDTPLLRGVSPEVYSYTVAIVADLCLQ